MPIAISCKDCGRDYRLKDELAGKKIKCKDCGATVAVPAPRRKGDPVRPSKKKNDDEDFLDALSSSGLEDGDVVVECGGQRLLGHADGARGLAQELPPAHGRDLSSQSRIGRTRAPRVR